MSGLWFSPGLRFDSEWPVFLGIAFLMALAATPLFAAADSPPSPQPNRLLTIDGLRGYLALGVFFQHTAVYHVYLVGGEWQLPPNRFYILLGPVAVSLFFMITGYLFWAQMIRTEGRPPWVALYIGRVYRLTPLYFAAVAVLFAVVFSSSGFHLHESLTLLLKHIGLFLTAGILQANYLNAYPDPPALLAHVMWTLHYEWKFYFLLPVVAIFTRSRRVHLPFVLVLLFARPLFQLATGQHHEPELTVLPLFLLGMLTASLKDKHWLRRPPEPLASLLITALLVASFFAGNPIQALLPQLLLGAVFYLIAAGSNLFGLLTMRPALRLGDVSYGIYLLQGLILAAIFRMPWSYRLDASPTTHWLISLAGGIILVSIATVTHVWIERVGIRRGRKMIATLRTRFPRYV